MPSKSEEFAAIDKAAGKPAPGAAVVVAGKSAYIDFRGVRRKLVSAYLCPWDRFPLLAIWEWDDKDQKAMSNSQLNGDLGITDVMRLRRKDYSASLVKAFQMAGLQGCVAFDYVPGQPDSVVARLAQIEEEVIAAVLKKDEKARKAARAADPYASRRSGGAKDLMDTTMKSINAGRHQHALKSYAYSSPREEGHYTVGGWKEGRLLFSEAAFDERFQKLVDVFGEGAPQVFIIRSFEPRTVLSECFLRTVFGVLASTLGPGGETQQRGRTSPIALKNMFDYPATITARLAWAQHARKLYFRTVAGDAMARLASNVPGMVRGYGAADRVEKHLLYPLPDVVGTGPPMYLFNMSHMEHVLRLRAHDLARVGMPEDIPVDERNYGMGSDGFPNVLLFLEAAVSFFSEFGDLRLGPVLESYIRENVATILETIVERMSYGKKLEKQRTESDYDRNYREAARYFQLPDRDPPPKPGIVELVTSIRDKTLTQEKYRALPADVKNVVFEWMRSGIVVDATSGERADLPFGLAFAPVAETAAHILSLLATPPTVGASLFDGTPELVLDPDALKDVPGLKAKAAATAVPEAKPAMPAEDAAKGIVPGDWKNAAGVNDPPLKWGACS